MGSPATFLSVNHSTDSVIGLGSADFGKLKSSEEEQLEASTPQQLNPTVVLVDRSEILLDGIEALLEREGIGVVGKASTQTEAVRFVETLKPAVVMVGPYMGRVSDADDVDVETMVRDLRSASPDTEIMLTVNADAGELERLRQSVVEGITGIVDMDAPTANLVQAFRDLIEGHSHVAAHIGVQLVGNKPQEPIATLTVREIEILTAIALGYTNAEIADQTHLSVRTVEANRSKINQKLGAASRSALVRVALDYGLVGSEAVRR